MAVALEEGWVPRRLLYEGEEPIVELVLRGHGPLTKPFFYQDLFGFREKRRLPLSSFDIDPDLSDGLYPSGFIFHMSRCGSTAAARMLTAIEGNIVLIEPHPLVDIFSPPRPLEPEVHARRLRQLVGIYARGLLEPGQRLIVKWTSWTIALVALIQRALPRVPAVFVYRDPIEVMVSALETPPGWLRAREARAARIGDSGVPVDLPEDEFCAHMLARFCRLAAAAPEPVVPVSYSDLPQTLWQDVGPHFGLKVTERERERMVEIGQLDTKDASQQRIFLSDGPRKRDRSTPRIRLLADTVVAPALEELKLASHRSA
jgi:hypothetical protein